MNELLDEMELALSDLLQAGLASAGPEAAGRLRTLARQGEQAGLHTGAQLLEEVAADLEARAHRMQKDDQALTDRVACLCCSRRDGGGAQTGFVGEHTACHTILNDDNDGRAGKTAGG